MRRTYVVCNMKLIPLNLRIACMPGEIDNADAGNQKFSFL